MIKQEEENMQIEQDLSNIKIDNRKADKDDDNN